MDDKELDEILSDIKTSIDSSYEDIVPKNKLSNVNYEKMADMLVSAEELKDLTKEIESERIAETKFVEILNEEQKLEYAKNKTKRVNDFASKNGQKTSMLDVNGEGV